MKCSRMRSLFELLPVGFDPTGPYATITVAHAFSGTVHWNVMVVPDIVPVMVTLPFSELLMTTSASVAPWRSSSVAPTIFPVIVSPSWALQCVRLTTSPVCGRLPVGWSRLPGPVAVGLRVPAPADAVSANIDSASAAATSSDFDTRNDFLERTSVRSTESHMPQSPLS